MCFLCENEKQPVEMQNDNYTVKFFGTPLEINLLTFFIRKCMFFSPYSVQSKNEFCVEIVNKLLANNNYDYIVVRHIEPVFLCGLYNRTDLIVDVDDLPMERLRSYMKETDINICF